jgi:hypothetical protein
MSIQSSTSDGHNLDPCERGRYRRDQPFLSHLVMT